MIRPTEYCIDNPDFDPPSCIHVRLHNGKATSIIIGNEFDCVEILAEEWDHVAEAVYKLLEDYQ